MAEMATNYANLQQDRNADMVNPAQTKTATNSKRMSGATAILFILVALILDGIQAFLTLIIIGVVLNWIITIIAALLFYMWLKSLNIPMIGGRSVVGTIFQTTGIGVEIFPMVNAFLGWTMFAIAKVTSEFMR